jgi:hypothetical protein
MGEYNRKLYTKYTSFNIDYLLKIICSASWILSLILELIMQDIGHKSKVMMILFSWSPISSRHKEKSYKLISRESWWSEPWWSIQILLWQGIQQEKA